MKNIFTKIVSKDETKKPLTSVLVTGNKLVATNSYSLIEVKHEALNEDDQARLKIINARSPMDIVVKPEELDMKKEILETMPIEDGQDFPDYQKVMPSESDLNAYFSVVEIDPRRLSDMLLAIIKTFKRKQYQSVKLYIPTRSEEEGSVFNKKVLVKRADDSVIGIVMPLNS